jgi:hypothetical protein
MSAKIAFVPGQTSETQPLLARYLPPVPAGPAILWLQDNIPSAGWVLDPFGASPHVPVQIARAGYRILVTANNPIARFLIEFAANPPNEHELRNTLAYLAAARKGEERLEPHIKDLYATICVECGQVVSADAFLWEREAATPYAKIYHCPHCGDSGERPVTPDDEARAQKFSSGGLHRARALERVVSANDPDRSHAEEALSTYLPRAVYALFTLINKVESFDTDYAPDLSSTQQLKRNLDALLLSAFDKANTLWSYPIARERPKQLTVPPRFREINIWMALEDAVTQLSDSSAPINLTIWPELPEEKGGVCIYEGRLKDLRENFQSSEHSRISFDAVVAAFPRHNQAYWTLSALWAGWLWGREALGPFKSVLRRRRYDWSWDTAAFHSALVHLVGLSNAATPFFGLLGEAEPGFLSAVLIAAELAGLDLEGVALRAESSQAQMLWRRPPSGTGQRSASHTKRNLPRENSIDSGGDIETFFADVTSSAAREYLIARAEPTVYLNLHSAGLIELIRTDTMAGLDISPADVYSRTLEAFSKAFSFRKGFLRYGGSEKSLEVGQWWLQEKPGVHITNKPLADRVEAFISRLLLDRPGVSLAEVDTSVCQSFRGLFTPNIELVAECLSSYGEMNPETGAWQPRFEDAPDIRRQDLMNMHAALGKIGHQLSYVVMGENPVLWSEPDNGKTAYVFYLTDSAIFGEFIFGNPYPPDRSLIVYPGGRSNLLAYKMRHDARLKQAFDRGWRLIKYRLLRRLGEDPLISRENLDERFSLDPVMYDAPQMRLL